MIRSLACVVLLLYASNVSAIERSKQYLSAKGVVQKIVGHSMRFDNRIFQATEAVAYFSADGWMTLWTGNSNSYYRAGYIVSKDGVLCFRVSVEKWVCGAFIANSPGEYVFTYLRQDGQAFQLARAWDIWDGDPYRLAETWNNRVTPEEEARRRAAREAMAKYALGAGAALISGAILYESLFGSSNGSEPQAGGIDCSGNEWQRSSKCWTDEMLRRNQNRRMGVEP